MKLQSKRLAFAAISLVSLTAVGLAAVSWPTKTTSMAAADPAEAVQAPAGVTPPPSGPTTFTVDPTMTPSVAEVEGLHEGDAPRPVGRLVTPDGTASDVVLDELAVSVPDAAALEDVAARLNATVADELGGGAYLLRIDPSDVDVSGLPADLESFEPIHAGDNTASSERTLQLLAALARETADHGTEVSLNWLTESDDIADGRTIEGFEDNPNSFTWSYLTTGGEQDTGVTAAWQLLENHGKLDNKVEIMIDDGGFVENKDLPDTRKIRKAEWGQGHHFGVHGTNVAIAAMGRVDNEFGAAGPAGPVGELIAVAHAKDTYAAFKRVRDMVNEEKPRIVNMSWSSDVTFGMAAARSVWDNFLESVKDRGVLSFAAASNDGRNVDSENCIGKRCWESRLVFPCESKHVICVGGLEKRSPWKAPGSNYGSKESDESVEIYGPYYTLGLPNPRYASVDWMSGTSFASPFVAGVAALVMAADPTLSAGEVWAILRDTAHTDGVGFDGVIDGHRRRVNALAAVMSALGVEATAPTVEITSPTDKEEVLPGTWLDLTATATDFKGSPLPITWAVDGANLHTEPTLQMSGYEFDQDRPYWVSATVTDVLGQTATTKVMVQVFRPAPEIKILSPLPDEKVNETSSVDLYGESEDPVTHGRLPENAVTWQIRRAGSDSVVVSKSGHVAQVSAGALTPGNYVATFTADHGTVVAKTREFRVIEVDGNPPSVVIDAPTNGSELVATEGHDVEVELDGRAFDTEDGVVAGTYFRWTVIDENLVERIACQGNNVPDDATQTHGGGIQAVVDCANDPTMLEVGAGAGVITAYTLRLDVWDASGNTSTDQVQVTVEFKAL